MTNPVSGGVPEQGLRDAAQRAIGARLIEMRDSANAMLDGVRNEAAWRKFARRVLENISVLEVQPLERPRPALPAPPSAGKRQWALEQIVAVMCERGLALDVLVSEIQDFLTMAGYDVPLRSYDTREGAALPPPEFKEGYWANVQESGGLPPQSGNPPPDAQFGIAIAHALRDAVFSEDGYEGGDALMWEVARRYRLRPAMVEHDEAADCPLTGKHAFSECDSDLKNLVFEAGVSSP